MKYDKQDEKEQSNRLIKIGMATTGVIASAFLLKKSGSLKYLSKAIDDVGSTFEKISNDLSSKAFKDLDYTTLKKVANKNIFNENSTWKMARADTSKIELDYSRGLLSSILQYNNIKGDRTYLENNMFNSLQKSKVMESLYDSFKSSKEATGDFFAELTKLVDDTLHNKSKFLELDNEQIKIVKSEFEDRINGSILEKNKDKIQNVLEEAINKSKEIESDFTNEYREKIKDKLVDNFKEELINKYTDKKDTFFENTMDRAATVRDLLTNAENKNIKISNNDLFEGSHDNIIETLQSLVKEDDRFYDLVIDNATLRVNKNNELYSTKGLNDLKYSLKEEAADTIMGKLFHVRSFVDNQKAPDFFYLGKGSYDSILGKQTGSKTGILKDDFFKLGDSFYKYSNGSMSKLEGVEDFYLISGKHGSFNTLLNRIQGNTYEKIQDNPTLKKLDFNTTGVNIVDNFKGFFSKFDEDLSWLEHLPKRLFNKDNYKDITNEKVVKFYSDISDLNKLYNHQTFAPTKKTLNELSNVLSPSSKKILEAANHDNIAEYILNNNLSNNLENKDLSSLLNKYKKNISVVKTEAQIGNLGEKDGMNILKYNDLLKREIVKEALLKDVIYENKYLNNHIEGYAITHGKIKKINLTGADRHNINNIFNWGIIQKETATFSSSMNSIKDVNVKAVNMNKLGTILNGTSNNQQTEDFLNGMRTNINNFVKSNTSWIKDSIIENDNSIKKGFKNNDWVVMRKAVSPLDIIKNLNDETKFNSTTNKFFKQFYAGRNNSESITTMTFLPYHMTNRLISPMEKFGLGASAANNKSVLDQIKFLGLKRILPAAAIIYGASYLNFEAENLTGQSFTQDYYNAKAHFGLGIKTISQITGFDDKHRRSRMYNPIANYYLGEYKDKDEYLDYLENGYDPVRKGKWWSFGSSSEFRGGKISYWEPNKLRQAYSHYKDISLYGSVDEKWKHSLIPTPRHPFSTIRFLSNPYWLEEKHYWDRPYPVTAPLFAEESPWGAILNPTIGQLIKPIKRMHQNELSGTLIDVRDIIAKKNKEIKEKSQDNRMVRVDDSGFTPMIYHPNSMPSLNEAVYNIQFNQRGKIQSLGFDGEQYSSNIADVSHAFMPVIKSGSPTDKQGIKTQYVNVENPHKFINSLLINGLTSLVTSGATSSQTVLGLIDDMNRLTKNKAVSNEMRSRGVINENAKLPNVRLELEEENAKNKYLDKLNINDIGTKTDYIADIMYSGKQLSGMYGFLLDTIIPAKHGYKLENAGKMNSFVRSFWDNNYGGVGGDFMEIARRFFPHEDHNIEKINPLKNTMPEWLPGRFQKGDPYTKVTKGEARLPGKGYEALNKLHPDSYGRYGAFDRYKILADVAPGSDEYKTWKKIVKREINNNPELTKEMEDIEKRVDKQSLNHTFYNYQFLGKHMKNINAIIDEVDNKGNFTIVGSQQKFSLAGVTPLMDSQTKHSYVHDYLKQGMMVQLQFENNKYRSRNSVGNIVAIVKENSTNISKQMWEDKKAKEKDNKETLADSLFAASDHNKFMGPIYELIGHAQIPYIHNKYLRIDSPMESYKKEQIYGSNFSTWEHPIKGYILPSFQTGWSKGLVAQSVGVASWWWSNKAREKDLQGVAKYASHALFAFTNPYALTGGIIGAIPRMNWGSKASKWNSKNGANIAATVGLVGYGFAHLNNPFLSAFNFGVAGYSVAKQLKIPKKEFPTLSNFLKITEKETSIIGGKEGAIIGAGIGIALSALKNPEFSLNKLTDKYIPKRTQEKWEMEEYFDRLEYIKYTNLYHKAAKLAKKKDGVDIEKIVNKFEYNREKNEKAIKKLEKQKTKINNFLINSSIKNKLSYTIDNEIYKLETPEQYYKMGEYTKAALAYKKAADTTIYGLTNKSSFADVLRALPKYDRDYFNEFAKEKDPNERKKILKLVSPYKAKALHILWQDDKAKKLKSNNDFFSTHNLPNLFWRGWRSDVDLENVKMKTIENEGMLLSDFGYYDSATNSISYKQAPSINNIHSSPSPLALKRDLTALLHGAGLNNSEVTVEPSSSSGFQVIANITRATQYNINQKVQSVLSNIL